MPKLFSTNQMRSICIIVSTSYLLIACNGSGSSAGPVTGSDGKRRGTRNIQTLSYAFFSPIFEFSAEEQDFIEGFFGDVSPFLRTLTDVHIPLSQEP